MEIYCVLYKNKTVTITAKNEMNLGCLNEKKNFSEKIFFKNNDVKKQKKNTCITTNLFIYTICVCETHFSVVGKYHTAQHCFRVGGRNPHSMYS